MVKGLFKPSDFVTVKCYVDGQIGMQPILSLIVPIKTIKGATRQCPGGGDRVVRSKQTLWCVHM